MMPYKRTSAPEHVRQLVDEIEKYHEKFCSADDPDDKVEALRLMKGYAMEYLNQVVHCHKLKTVAVERVLTQSVLRSPDFDAREASEAFEHLAKYGQNLLEHPWREEFRVLNLSSGYYVHYIQAYLENPHEILIAMGYANINDDVLQLATAPIAALLKQISRDCFLASQECLILSKISDFVQTQTSYRGITAAEIYKYRIKLTGDVITIGKRICYELHQKQYNDQLRTRSQAGMQQQQQQQQQHRYQYDAENCPVDELVDIGLSRDPELPEREIVRNVLRHTQREQLQEHIYDPVPGEDFVAKGIKVLSPKSPSINTSTTNFVYPGEQSQFPYHASHQTNGFNHHHNSEFYNNSPSDFGLPQVDSRYAYDTRSSTASPYIPKTVTAFDSYGSKDVLADNRKQPSQSHSSSSSSATSYRGGPFLYPKALERNKVSQDEIQRRYSGSTTSTNALNNPDWLSVELEKQNLSRQQPPQQEYSRLPMNALQDAKSLQQPQQAIAEPDDVLTDAYRYKQGVNALVSNNKARQSENLTYGRPQLEPEFITTSSSKVSSDSRFSSDRDFEAKSSGSSEASSWDFAKENRATLEWYGAKSKHDTHGNVVVDSRVQSTKVNQSDNCVEEYETEYRREYAKPKTSKPPATETDLDSLETFNATQESEVSSPFKTKTDSYVGLKDYNRCPVKYVEPENSQEQHKSKIVFQVDNDDSSAKTNDLHEERETKDKIGKKGKGKKQGAVAVEKTDVDTSEPWSCPHCTYINHTDDKICGVCCKTRDFADEEAPPSSQEEPVLKLSSETLPKPTKPSPPAENKDAPKDSVTADSIVCPFCTFHNPKTRVLCEMCEQRLKNNNFS